MARKAKEKTETEPEKINDYTVRSLQLAKAKFQKIVEETIINTKWLSYQSITLNSSVLSYDQIVYLINKYKELQHYKNKLSDIIIERINNGALHGEFQQTASIWRMKQLGETDKTVQETINHNVEVSAKEAAEISKGIKNEL